MQRRKKCFVVCPLGDDGSTTRQNADDLFDLVILPALEKYGFDVIRADRIPRTSVITSDVIELVQTADLCVIDLTGHNPNVFYECGRRHETGKPYIHLLKKGESRPFDVAGVRDIQYDLSTARTVHDCKLAIQTFIDELERTGFEPTTSGVSLSTIVTAIERLDRRVSQLTATSAIALSGGDSPSGASYTDLLGNPAETYAEAVALGDLQTAERNLIRLESLFGIGTALLQKAIIITPASAVGARIVEKCLAAADVKTLAPAILRQAIGVTIQYYNMLDRESDLIPTMEPLVERVVKDRDDLSNEDRAFFVNQLGRLFAGAGDHEKSVEYVERAVQLNPTQPAYLYNLSLNYERMGMDQKALEAVKQYLALPEGLDDDDHIAQAVDLLAKNGELEDARKLFTVLAEKFPKRAQILLMTTEHVRAAVH